MLRAVIAAAVAVVILPTAAAADATVTYVSPTPDQQLDGPTELVVDVERRLIDPHPEQVQLRLSLDGTTPLADLDPVALSCIGGCSGEPSVTVSRWGGVQLDPADLSPFDGAPECNGRWWLVPEVTPGPTFRSSAAQGSFVVAEPAAAPADLTVAVEDRDVLLSWRPAAHDDLHSQRVERRSDGGAWTTIATLGATATSFRDDDLAPGQHDYRVTTVRPDGFVDGAPAQACEDNGADLTASSAVWTASIGDDGGSAAPDPSSSDPGTGGRDPSTGSTGGSIDGSTDGDTTGNGDGTAGGDSGSRNAPSSSSARTRIANSGGSNGGLELPSVGTSQSAPTNRARYFGEGEGFDESLDYAGVDAVTADEEARYALEHVPGGVIEVFDRELDLEHILRPVASGLVLIAIALHLRRWNRA